MCNLRQDWYIGREGLATEGGIAISLVTKKRLAIPKRVGGVLWNPDQRDDHGRFCEQRRTGVQEDPLLS